MSRTPIILGALGAVTVPVAYLVAKHMSWESTREGKLRMLTHHLTFWSSAYLSVWLLLHKGLIFKAPGKTTGEKAAKWLKGISAAILPILGFEGGGRLGKIFFPRKNDGEELHTGQHQVQYPQSQKPSGFPNSLIAGSFQFDQPQYTTYQPRQPLYYPSNQQYSQSYTSYQPYSVLSY